MVYHFRSANVIFVCLIAHFIFSFIFIFKIGFRRCMYVFRVACWCVSIFLLCLSRPRRKCCKLCEIFASAYNSTWRCVCHSVYLFVFLFKQTIKLNRHLSGKYKSSPSFQTGRTFKQLKLLYIDHIRVAHFDQVTEILNK